MDIPRIEKEVHFSGPIIYNCMDKTLNVEAPSGPKDKYHCPKDPVITEEARAWVVEIGRHKPTAYG